MNKSDLRKEYLDIRNKIVSRDEKSKIICDEITNLDAYKYCDIIFVYMSINSEVNTMPIIDVAYKQGKKIAFPKVEGNHNMNFYSLTNDEFLNKNCWNRSRFGVLEPVPKSENQVKGEKNTFVIVPGVVFSLKKHRIGYGAGYYDRYLASNIFYASAGICYYEQISDKIKPQPHDCKLDFVITERGVF